MSKIVYRLVQGLALVNLGTSIVIAVTGLRPVSILGAWAAVGATALLFGVIDSHLLRVRTKNNMLKHARDTLILWPITIYEQYQFKKILNKLHAESIRLNKILSERKLTEEEEVQALRHMKECKKIQWFKDGIDHLKGKGK